MIAKTIYEEINRISDFQRRYWGLSKDVRFANDLQAGGKQKYFQVCEWDKGQQRFVPIIGLYYNPETNRFKTFI